MFTGPSNWVNSFFKRSIWTTGHKNDLFFRWVPSITILDINHVVKHNFPVLCTRLVDEPGELFCTYSLINPFLAKFKGGTTRIILGPRPKSTVRQGVVCSNQQMVRFDRDHWMFVCISMRVSFVRILKHQLGPDNWKRISTLLANGWVLSFPNTRWYSSRSRLIKQRPKHPFQWTLRK